MPFIFCKIQNEVYKNLSIALVQKRLRTADHSAMHSLFSLSIFYCKDQICNSNLKKFLMGPGPGRNPNRAPAMVGTSWLRLTLPLRSCLRCGRRS